MDKLRVYYGFSKLTKKAIRKRELAIYFENGSTNRNETFINRRLHLVHTRIQTKEEMKDADGASRMFTKYGQFIDEKPWFGDIEALLSNNFHADSKHVSEKERNLIREKLRKSYYKVYDLDPRNIQLQMIFE